MIMSWKKMESQEQGEGEKEDRMLANIFRDKRRVFYFIFYYRAEIKQEAGAGRGN